MNPVNAEFVILWVVMPCRVADGHWYFGGLWCLHLQGWK